MWQRKNTSFVGCKLKLRNRLLFFIGRGFDPHQFHYVRVHRGFGAQFHVLSVQVRLRARSRLVGEVVNAYACLAYIHRFESDTSRLWLLG
jgi:hypothetical protein